MEDQQERELVAQSLEEEGQLQRETQPQQELLKG